MTIDINGELNTTDKLFIAAYIRNKCNGTKAQKEIEPEMSDEVAASTASQRLRKFKVREAVDRKLQEIADTAEIDATWALIRRKEIVEQSMRAVPVLDKTGKQTGEYVFDAAGANKALDSIEKMHLGMADKSEVNHNIAIISKDDESL